MRYREHAVLVEGPRAIRTAIEHGTRVRTVLIDARRADAVDPDLHAAFASLSARVLTVAGEAFDSFVDTEHPQPVVAIVEMPEPRLPRMATLALALDGVRDPGNLGTLLRTACAASVDVVALLPGCVDPFNPKTVRASAGLVFAIPVARFESLAAVGAACFSRPPQVVLAEAEGDLLWDQYDWAAPTLLALGGEAGGASDHVRTYADIRVRLPMAPGVESLNVAAAGAALLFECVRQRLHAP